MPTHPTTHKRAEAVHQIDEPQAEALRLAEEISNLVCSSEAAAKTIAAAADELCRLHARIAELESQLDTIGAGGVSAPPTAQAEGWRLVPVEPTQKMRFAAMNAFAAASASLGAFNAPDAAYRALLAAAPTHPTSSVVVEHG